MNHRALLIEDDTVVELGEEVCEVEWSLDLPILCNVPIPQQLNPAFLDVEMFHLAPSTCVLDEADGGARVDIDDKWVRYIEL